MLTVQISFSAADTIADRVSSSMSPSILKTMLNFWTRESPSGAFAPMVIHYVETFIVPAAVGAYTIRPYGESEGKTCVTMKAYVRKDNLIVYRIN